MVVQESAVRDTLRRPLVSMDAGDVENRKRWVDLSSALLDFPAVEASEQGDKGALTPILAQLLIIYRI